MSDQEEKKTVVSGPTLEQECRLGIKIGERIIEEVKHEWFTMAQLHKASKATNDEIKNMLGHLQAFGMLRQKMEEDKHYYKVVTTKEERDTICNEGIQMMNIDKQRLEYAMTKMNRIIEIDPWKGLKAVN